MLSGRRYEVSPEAVKRTDVAFWGTGVASVRPVVESKRLTIALPFASGTPATSAWNDCGCVVGGSTEAGRPHAARRSAAPTRGRRHLAIPDRIAARTARPPWVTRPG